MILGRVSIFRKHFFHVEIEMILKNDLTTGIPSLSVRMETGNFHMEIVPEFPYGNRKLIRKFPYVPEIDREIPFGNVYKHLIFKLDSLSTHTPKS